MDNQALIGQIYGDDVDRLIDELWDYYSTYVEYRRALYARHKSANRALIRAAMPTSAEDRPDVQLGRAMQAELTKPRYLYLNQRQWEDAPAKLGIAVAMMDLIPLTSNDIPENRAFMTIDEFNPDDLGKAMTRGQKLPVLQ